MRERCGILTPRWHVPERHRLQRQIDADGTVKNDSLKALSHKHTHSDNDGNASSPTNSRLVLLMSACVSHARINFSAASCVFKRPLLGMATVTFTCTIPISKRAMHCVTHLNKCILERLLIDWRHSSAIDIDNRLAGKQTPQCVCAHALM